MAQQRSPLWKRPWFLITVGLLVTAAVVVAVVLPMLLDVERHRPRIEQALRDATGWEPELGSIDLTVFPQPAVHVGSSRLGSPNTESSIAIGSLDVAAAFWPLFKGRLEIEDVTLDAPQVTLIRNAGDAGWDIPVPSLGDTGDSAQGGGPGLVVEVRRIRLRKGTVHVEDRSVEPARVITLDPFSMTLLPAGDTFEGSATLAPDGGDLRWEGTFSEGVTITLADLATGRLSTIVGSDLLQPGGTLSGTVEVGIPFAVTGALTGRNLALSTGERPIGAADLTFRVVGDANGMQLETTRLSLGQIRIDGSGRLTPKLDLALDMPEAPLEATLEAFRGVAQFPLDVEGPGTASAKIKIYEDKAATVHYSAVGRFSARRLNAVEFLPPVEDLKATFDLSQEDRLTVHVLEGQVAGGPMRGTIELHPVDPPGTLTFDGTLRGAEMGGLLAGFVQQSAEKIVGPTSVDAKVTVDLARAVIDANAVGGTVGLSSGTITLPGWDVEGKIANELSDRLSSFNLTSLVGDKGKTSLGSSKVPVAFDAMKAQLKLDTIPWSLDGLRMNRDGGALNGGGSFNPLDGTVDINLDVELSLDRSAKLVREHKSLKVLLDPDGHIRLPMSLAGALDQPSVDVDLKGLAGKALGTDEGTKDLVNKLKGLFDKKKD